MNIPSLNYRLPKLFVTMAALAALTGCCEPGGTPVPIHPVGVRTTKVPKEDRIDVKLDPQPNTSGPHQINIALTTKGDRPVAADDINAVVSRDKHTVTITVKTADAFSPVAP